MNNICLIGFLSPYFYSPLLLRAIPPIFMENENDFASERNNNDLAVQRFEDMLRNHKSLFFDVDEFEDLLDFYNSKSNYIKALEVAKLALEQHPKSSNLLTAIAQLYLSIHKPQEALKYLNLAESYEPFNFDLIYTKAGVYSQLRKSDKAIDLYKKALQLAEENDKEDILLQLAFEFENINKYNDAIQYLKEILLTNKENETALYELGFCFDFSEQIDQGRMYFKSFVDQNPYSYIGWYNLGITYGKLDLHEKAIHCYEFSIAIKEDFSAAYFNKAHSLNKLGQYVEALTCFNETLQYDTEDSLCYFYIGESFEKLEDFPKAISYYKRALQRDEYMADAWYGIASCYYELDRILDCISYVNKAISYDEYNPEYFYLLGEAQSENSFDQEALTSFEKVYELDPSNPTILIDLANTAKKLNEHEEATNYFVKGVREQKGNAKLIYNFVAFLLEKEDLINAMFYLDVALKEHYEERNELFDAYEEAKYNQQVIDLFDYYKK